MDKLNPIYTEKRVCQDCYKCVRECAVKAISFESIHARIDPDRCICCGACVTVCPSGAKRGREEGRRLRHILAQPVRKVVSLAPSYRSEFPEFTDSQIAAGLRALGFDGVSETALGAEYVTLACRRELRGGREGYLISSACPGAVEYIRKYRPEFLGSVTEFYSPLLTHAALIKEDSEEECAVVFIGPCLAKKMEADNHPGLLRAAITFEDLRHLWEEADISPGEYPLEGEEPWVLGRAGKASLYPLAGGMIESIGPLNGPGIRAMAFSGIRNIAHALDNLPGPAPGEMVFLELLACEGGCINGPKSTVTGQTIRKTLDVRRREGPGRFDPSVTPEITASWSPLPRSSGFYGEEEIRDALSRIGKREGDDELNCGGCGYNTCRDFAGAFLDGRAETIMCVSHMRQLAQKKAHAVITKMPSGICIVDRSMRVVECNARFVKILGGEAELLWESRPGLEGALLSRLVPFSRLFEQVLENGIEVLDRQLAFGERILSATVFPIQEGEVAGGIFQDITEPWVNRDNIVKKAQDVIAKNLETVQKIAYLLGENAADNEVILNSIISSFSSPEIPGPIVQGGGRRG